MKRAPSIPVGSLVPTPPHTHKRLSKYAVLNEVSFIITGLECGTGVPAHMLPTLGPFPSSFRRRLSEPERTNSTLTHTHYTRRLTHLHSECARVTDKSVELSVLLRRGFKVQVQASRGQIPLGSKFHSQWIHQKATDFPHLTSHFKPRVSGVRWRGLMTHAAPLPSPQHLSQSDCGRHPAPFRAPLRAWR